VGSESDEQTDESFLAAAMGDSEAVKAYRRDDVDVDRQQQQPTSRSTGGVGIPTGTLPLARLDTITPEERRRAARKRGLDWPTTEQARDEAVEIAEEHGSEYTVLRSRHEACPVAAGNYDPPSDRDAEEELEYEQISSGASPSNPSSSISFWARNSENGTRWERG
jgi:hypothetical protein